jgi:hypothetical protein
MKKILLLTNVITLALLYFNSCTTSIHSMSTSDGTIMVNYKKSDFKGLKADFIEKMIDNYAAASPINGNLNSDARTVWFNLDTLKKFIWYVENKSIENGFKSGQLEKLGLRLYYIRYPASSTDMATFTDLRGLNPSFANKHSVMMIPTYYNSTRGYNVEFDPTKFDATGNPFSYEKLMNNPQTELTVFRTMGDPSSSMTQNHGDLIPPLSPGYNGADLLQYADHHP